MVKQSRECCLLNIKKDLRLRQCRNDNQGMMILREYFEWMKDLEQKEEICQDCRKSMWVDRRILDKLSKGKSIHDMDFDNE